MFQNSLIAIDIGSYAIKVAEITGTEKKRIVRLGVKVLPPGIIVGGNINDTQVVELSLAQLLKEMKVRRAFRRAVISLSGINIIVKRFNLIRNENMETSDQIFMEAEKHLKMDMNEIYFDFNIENPNSELPEQAVLIAATKRETLNERISILKEAGIGVGVVDSESFALTNLIEYNYGRLEGLCVVVNVGASSSNIVFVHEGRYMYGREIGIGGEHYTKAIAESSSLSFEAAEDRKMQLSSEQHTISEQTFASIANVNEQFLSEFQLAVDFFNQSGEGPVLKTDLKGIFMTGGGSLMFGMSGFLRERLQIPVAVFDPFEKMHIPKRFKGIENIAVSPMFGVVAGLSLRHFEDNET
jgi:type IV pilus assembly protein PilM